MKKKSGGSWSDDSYILCQIDSNGSNSYIVNGKKVKLSVSQTNKKPIEEIVEIKQKYDESLPQLTYEYFNDYKERFIVANADRFNTITADAKRDIQEYLGRYAIEDMMVSFSGGKDSTVTSHIVRKALGTNKIIHIYLFLLLYSSSLPP